MSELVDGGRRGLLMGSEQGLSQRCLRWGTQLPSVRSWTVASLPLIHCSWTDLARQDRCGCHRSTLCCWRFASAGIVTKKRWRTCKRKTQVCWRWGFVALLFAAEWTGVMGEWLVIMKRNSWPVEMHGAAGHACNCEAEIRPWEMTDAHGDNYKHRQCEFTERRGFACGQTRWAVSPEVDEAERCPSKAQQETGAIGSSKTVGAATRCRRLLRDSRREKAETTVSSWDWGQFFVGKHKECNICDLVVEPI